ncbi:alpha/beta hydrolase, partial [Deinococcus wulumuqiensis]|uniref:alpha/beta hydrolase n=1 Tax=Deinococcus wulumuqiensis TaxID=980427 RepID=UPI00242BC6D8
LYLQGWDAAHAVPRGIAPIGRLKAAGVRVAALPVNEERSRRYVPFAFELNNFDPVADEYLDWIRETLKPELTRRFGPVAPARTALAGSSFGGLITLYAGLRDPGEYGTWGVLSPAIWPADFALRRWMSGRSDPQARVWLDMGDHEGPDLKGAAEIVKLTHALAADLSPLVREVQVTIGQGHWHDEAAWRARLPAFLRWWVKGSGSA